MRYNLKGTNIDLSAEIRAYIEKKLAGLDPLLGDGAVRADIELEYLPNEAKAYRAELMLHNNVFLRAESRGQTLHEAFDKAIQELFIELSRGKRKKVRTFRHSAARVKEYLRGWRSKL